MSDFSNEVLACRTLQAVIVILAIQISRQIERNQPNIVTVDEIMTKGKVDQGLGVER